MGARVKPEEVRNLRLCQLVGELLVLLPKADVPVTDVEGEEGRALLERRRRQVTLGGGKRLFDRFTKSLDLEHTGLRQSPFATFIDYRVNR